MIGTILQWLEQFHIPAEVPPWLTSQSSQTVLNTFPMFPDIKIIHRVQTFHREVRHWLRSESSQANATSPDWTVSHISIDQVCLTFIWKSVLVSLLPRHAISVLLHLWQSSVYPQYGWEASFLYLQTSPVSFALIGTIPSSTWCSIFVEIMIITDQCYFTSLSYGSLMFPIMTHDMFPCPKHPNNCTNFRSWESQ